MREFLKLREIYNIEDLDLILEYCIDNEIYRIEDIKEVLKNKYFDIVVGEKNINIRNNILSQNSNNPFTSDGLIRETSYYEEGQN